MKKIFVIMLVSMMGATCFAGNQAENKEQRRREIDPQKVVEMRVAKMQQRLMLDDKQAEKFASIYKEYLSELNAECGNQGAKSDKKGDKKPQRIDDKQMKEWQKTRLDNEKKRAEIKAKYYDKMSSVLNAQQLEVVFFKSGIRGGKPVFGKKPMTGGNFGRMVKSDRPQQREVCPEGGQPLETR